MHPCRSRSTLVGREATATSTPAPATASAEPPLGSHDRGDPLALSCGIECTREKRVGKHSVLAGSVLSSASASCTFEDNRRTDRQHVCQTQMCMCTHLGLNRIACTPASWPAHIVCLPLCQIPYSNVRDPEGHLVQEARLVGRASRRGEHSWHSYSGCLDRAARSEHGGLLRGAASGAQYHGTGGGRRDL